MGPNGERYDIPLGTSNTTTVLFANEPLIEELGFDLPETYDDIVAMVSAADTAGIEVVTIDGADQWAWGSCLLSAIIPRTSGDPNWVSKAVSGENAFTDTAFVDALSFIETMVDDGVIKSSSINVDYDGTISKFSNEEALFMGQGQWAAGEVDTDVSDSMVMMVWPEVPGETSVTAGSVAAAWQVGYGMTRAATADAEIQDAAINFLNFIHGDQWVTQRLKTGSIVAPILAACTPPSSMPNYQLQKIRLAQSALNTEVIDAYLTGDANDRLNAGMQQIVLGNKTPGQVTAEVEALVVH